MFFSEIMF